MAIWLMWVIAIVVVVLPAVLAVAFNGRDRADARGRRVDHRWRAPRVSKQ
ncbi:hypothetical protein [Egibacter rhizosphaerae]|nr:hypothetical protein [Egibacter rhizosphaerae]